jgi:hypothetical protein
MRSTLVALMLAATSVSANTEIHRCMQDDGTIAFQETPCPEPATDKDVVSDDTEVQEADEVAEASDDASDFVNPFDEPPPPPPIVESPLPEPVSGDRAECEKMIRDAIDAIDLEMREQAYTKEQGDEYLSQLLALTRQLRACKQL